VEVVRCRRILEAEACVKDLPRQWFVVHAWPRLRTHRNPAYACLM
jgi:hypothetical protein